MKKHNEKPAAFETKSDPAAPETGATRREFIGKSIAAGAGLALAAILQDGENTAQAQSCTPAAPVAGQPLATIGEIAKPTGSTGPVKGTIKVLNEKKTYLRAPKSSSNPVCETGQMRYLSGSVGGRQVWPLTQGNPSPGPTIRARVGDKVEITLMNQVDSIAFAKSIDAGVSQPLDKGNGCDNVVQTGPTSSSNIYPGNPAFDVMPNCFHGSATANLHYHGTHVSPSNIQDNVFVQVRPSPRVAGKPVVDEAYLQRYDFGKIFTACEAGHSPQKWGDLPPAWQAAQKTLLQQYDAASGLLPNEQLWPKDAADIAASRWPSYYVGAYPSCFQPPVWNNQPNSMGQSPGTHWYHAHKHGSTALNLSNGMAGALIIEGPYDDALKPLYNGKEVVIVLQQYDASLNLERAAGTTVGEFIYVNGQYQPVITMQPGEVQFWRIINACHQKQTDQLTVAPAGLKWIQTAQDGVQLHPDNYQLGVTIAQAGGGWTNPTLATPMTTPPWFGNLAPGNRVDLLVQAPQSGGPFKITAGGQAIATVQVSGNPVSNPKQFPPAKASLPTMPGFLGDITRWWVDRQLHFKSDPSGGPPAPAPPSHTINDHKFEDNHFQETVGLGSVEQWTLFNDNVGGGGAAHPFHIHINPFQVVAIKTAANAPEIQLPQPWIWWDNIAIPVGGSITMRSRFVDFDGAYVLHCHILAHEDRGMMEMVQVVPTITTLGHH